MSQRQRGGPFLAFLSDEADEGEGLGHAGIETYRDDPYAATARETGQNSNDAAASRPVQVSYDRLVIDAADLPAIDDLRTTVGICLRQATGRGVEKEVEFFSNARNVLGREKIDILRISDAGTTGLLGPDTRDTPFHALLKAAGVSNKASDDAGGSFGIGKNAPYAISDLQTVFYSTVYADAAAGGVRFLAQGKTILVSHTDASGKRRRGAAYWGEPGFRAVSDPARVPEWLRQSDVGLSVYSAGFRKADDWQYRIAGALLANFFSAIHNQDLEFSINHHSIILNRGTLRGMFDDEQVVAAAQRNDQYENLVLAKSLYECLVSDAAEETVEEIRGLGRISIRVLVREDLPKRVCILRNGMVITDTLEHFGDRLLRFPMHRDFVAVVEPLDYEARKLIRSLENPHHNGLSAERIPDQAKREGARYVMRKLKEAIRSTIRRFSVAAHGAEVHIDELAPYFAGPERDPATHRPSDEDDPETIRITPVVVKEPRRTTGGTTSGGGRGGSTGGGRGSGTGTSRGGGSGTAGYSRVVELRDFRNTFTADGDQSKRVLFFTPAESGPTTIELEGVLLNENERLTVRQAEGAAVVSGCLRADIEAGRRSRITVEFDSAYTGPLEFRAKQTAGGETGQ